MAGWAKNTRAAPLGWSLEVFKNFSQEEAHQEEAHQVVCVCRSSWSCLRLELRKMKKDHLIHIASDRQAFSVTISPPTRPRARGHAHQVAFICWSEHDSCRLWTQSQCFDLMTLVRPTWHLNTPLLCSDTEARARLATYSTWGHFKLKEGCSQYRREADEGQWKKKRINNHTIKQKWGHRVGF